MERRSYFSLVEFGMIILLASTSALINTWLPIKSIAEHLSIPGPAAGMALLGGGIFVLWISLAHRITGKKYSGIITSIIIASICLLIHPWYGVVEPSWFSIYGIVGLLSMGVIVEVTGFGSFLLGIFGGGLGNLSCLVITWLAIGFHTGAWTPAGAAPFLIFSALISGSAGVLLAHGIARVIKERSR